MSNLQLWRELDRPFAGFGGWNPLLRQLDDYIAEAQPKAAFDYEETKDAFVLTFDVPGADKEQLHVAFHKNQLEVSGERKRHGGFKSVVALPEGIQAGAIKADYENGVLTVTVPKAAEPEALKIAIGNGKVS